MSICLPTTASCGTLMCPTCLVIVTNQSIATDLAMIDLVLETMHDPFAHDCVVVGELVWDNMRAPQSKSSASVSLDDLPSLHAESSNC